MKNRTIYMYKFIKLFFFVFILFLSSLPLISQRSELEEEYIKIGVTAGFSINTHNASFQDLPGELDCCGGYTGGSGFGPTIGVLGAIPVMEDSRLMLRLGYFDLSGDMLETNTISDQTLVSIPAEAEFHFNSAIASLNLTTEYEWNFIDRFNLYGGGMFGLLIKGEVQTFEKLISPAGAYYVETQSNIRGDQFTFREIPEKQSFQAWIGGGLGYSVPLNTIFLEPFVRYYYPITNLTTVDWNVSPLTFGIDAYVELTPEKESIEKTIYVRDTVIVREAGATERVELISEDETEETLEDDDKITITKTVTQKYQKTLPLQYQFTAALSGNYRDYAKIVIEETETREAFPLLPYVFFEAESDDLSATSQMILSESEAESFDPLQLNWDALDIHSNLLNIIGRRMVDNPSANITLTGTNNAIGSEKDNLKLSSKRADRVKEYLIESWNIDPKRINTTSRNLPSKPGRTDIQEGQAENSRVELSSDTPLLTGYLNMARIETSSNPPSVEIISELSHSTSETDYEYKLEISQNGSLLRTVDGVGKEDIVKAYTWNIGDKPMPAFDDYIDIELVGRDEYGVIALASDSIMLEQLTIRKKREILKNDKIVERFSLIVFDYDSAVLTPTQKANLAYAKSAIKPNSSVLVDGYTDNIGSEEYNLDLSARRIEEVVKTLGLEPGNNVNDIIKKPHGAKNPPYSNATPKGRSYNRTVIITILNPVDK